MGLRRFIQRNFWAKFLSFVLAFMTWLSIRSTSEDNAAQAGETETISVETKPSGPLPNLLTPGKPPAANAIVKSKPVLRQVAILKPPGDSHTYQVKPVEVEVVIKGENEQLDGMDVTEIRVFVDITAVLEKFNTAEQHAGIPVRIDVHTPKSVALEKVTPALATVKRIPPPESPKKPEVKPAETLKPEENGSTNTAGLIKAATNVVDRAAASTNAVPESGETEQRTDSQEQPEENKKQTKAESVGKTGSADDKE